MAKDRSACLLEGSLKGRVIYWATIRKTQEFTYDANDAVQFPNELSAQKYLDAGMSAPRGSRFKNDYKVVEHLFVEPASAPTKKE